jgi:hypothetical protein
MSSKAIACTGPLSDVHHPADKNLAAVAGEISRAQRRVLIIRFVRVHMRRAAIQTEAGERMCAPMSMTTIPSMRSGIPYSFWR